MAVLSQAFLDESGGLDSSHFVIGGYVGSAEMWKHFSDDWQGVLNGSHDGLPPWPPFHAAPCESGKEGFEVLPERDRKRRLGRLVQIIASHQPQAVVCLLDVEKFKSGLLDVGHVKKRKETWSHPYSFGAHSLFGSLSILHDAAKKDFGAIETMFDCIDGSHRYQKSIEQSVLDVLEATEPELAKRLGKPRWLSAGERAHCAPVQAADLLVWHVGRSKNSPDGETRRAFRDLKKASPFKFLGPSGELNPQDLWIAGH